MKLMFLKEDALLTLKENLETYYDNYSEITNDWIIEEFGGISPFGEFKIEVPDINMYLASEKPEETDYENVKRVYFAMRALTDTQASDERLWSGLAHGQFWSYMQYRWSKARSSVQNVKSRFFYAHSKRRSLFTNTLSRLWWTGRLVYDEKREDPFELLKFFEAGFTTNVVPFFSRNYSSNPKITMAVLSIFKEYLDENPLNASQMRKSDYIWKGVLRYVNLLGGLIILDYLTEEELADKIRIKMQDLISEAGGVENA